jgi:alpha-mannosidase
MKKKQILLVCNAHLDPIWLWQLKDGIAEALSTFRVAANFCDRYEGFVFNHNEAYLYELVEKYEPELFERIKQLVTQGKWHIMGGWYIQPDCNMPSGEAMFRQITYGLDYFRAKFGHRPTTAINFDSFGHTRGLVQILHKTGFDSYLFCRPSSSQLELPGFDILWQGYDGSQIMVQRHFGGYSNHKAGDSLKNIQKYLTEYPDKEFGMILWGIGNHGGGPSEEDLKNIETLRKERTDYEVVHSTPEAYFSEIAKSKETLPVFDRSMNYIHVGCYTSQIQIKKQYRKLENELFSAEKMASAAHALAGTEYPALEFLEAQKDMMLTQFHDVLCGTMIQSAEEDVLRMLGHGIERAQKAKTDAFFSLAVREKKAEKDTVPLFLFNPHPYPVEDVFECEYNMPVMNRSEIYYMPVLYQDSEKIPCQPEREESCLAIDWQKKISFAARLKPLSLTRLDICSEIIPAKPTPQTAEEDGKIYLKTNDLEFAVDTRTGTVSRYETKGFNYLQEGAFLPISVTDSNPEKSPAFDSNLDPWGMYQVSFRRDEEAFVLAGEEETGAYCGFKDRKVKPVRVIEEGDVRWVVEAFFQYRSSYLVMQYLVPKKGTKIGIRVRVYWNEPARTLKLQIPTTLQNGTYIGQTMGGQEELPSDGGEVVSQKWNALLSSDRSRAIIGYNDGIYGSDCLEGEIRPTLLRSAAYAYLCLDYGPDYRGNVQLPCFDIGERKYDFAFDIGTADEMLAKADREALLFNEKPYIQSFFPSGNGQGTASFLHLEGSDSVVMNALQKTDKKGEYRIRLQECAGRDQSFILTIPDSGKRLTVSLTAFAIETFLLDTDRGTLVKVIVC